MIENEMEMEIGNVYDVSLVYFSRFINNFEEFSRLLYLFFCLNSVTVKSMIVYNKKKSIWSY